MISGLFTVLKYGNTVKAYVLLWFLTEFITKEVSTLFLIRNRHLDAISEYSSHVVTCLGTNAKREVLQFEAYLFFNAYL